ncbi:MAG: histidine--tRNA ligase [Armatimonadota bacterium]|nr:histidine--tRNA ligase [Armatimonadota bacterium]MDR7429306.1 histidine--tRNA ligase [Armatimonadota bacterium]MDR7461351.1 histidine--tRNA ligase [Armatimonadota bacterium]MDR7477017.1 histidine--tRNA ligase [Armatimonadota bacterium]MDR7513305.1 histidine--tRNA ligase [Armatimonadota bacterium]
MSKYQAPRGMRDVLPPESERWQWLVSRCREMAHRYGYREIRTPLVEHTEVFLKGVGEGTDIVEHEMYTFADRAGRSLSLRPEGTAGVVRAYVEHGMHTWPQPVKLYYVAEMFRYDRPQAGRYRQHTQFGAEVLGVAEPAADVDVLSLAVRTLQALGLREVRVHLNSVGDPKCRPGYLQVFREYFQAHYDRLDEDSRRRLVTNPLRILDSKVEQTREIARGAPRMLDYLCPDCRAHFDAVRRHLEILGIAVEVDPLIVRGLDYYTRTAAEVHYPKLGAQSTLFGGGRYDGLAEVLGGPATPGVGFGMGLERVLMVLEEEGLVPDLATGVQVYVCHDGPPWEEEALRLVDFLRGSGLRADRDLLGRSLRAQLRAASRSGARWAVLVGVAEVPSGYVVLRDLRAGEQRPVPADQLPRILVQEEGECGRTGAAS